MIQQDQCSAKQGKALGIECGAAVLKPLQHQHELSDIVVLIATHQPVNVRVCHLVKVALRLPADQGERVRVCGPNPWRR